MEYMGDAFIALFENGEDAVSLMLEYQNFFRKHKLSMTPRIAGHYGEVYIFEDPMLNNRKNAVGEHINRTAQLSQLHFQERFILQKTSCRLISNLMKWKQCF